MKKEQFGLVVGIFFAVVMFAGDCGAAAVILKKDWPAVPLRGIAVGIYNGEPGRGYDSNGYLTEEPFRKMKQWNVNIIRFMVSVDKGSVWDVSEANGDTLPALGSDKLEPYQKNLIGLKQAIEYAEKYKIHYIIYIGQSYARNFPTEHYQDFKDNLVLLLEVLAKNYGNRKYFLGYTLLDEPHYSQEMAEILDHSLPNMLIEKIRAIDKESYITVMPGAWGMNSKYVDWSPLDSSHNYKVRYIMHMFAPSTFTHQGIRDFPFPTYYPGDNWSWANFFPEYRNFYNNQTPFPWDNSTLRDYLQMARDFQVDNDLPPMLIGSFCVVRWAEPGSAVQWLKDVSAIFDEYDWDQIWHTFGEWNGWNPTFDTQPIAYPAAFDGGYRSALFNELLRQWSKNVQYEVYETLGHWEFDGNTEDAALSGNNLIAFGCSYDSTDFRSGTASLKFNGSSDYLMLENVSFDDYFTISAWIKIADKNHSTAIIANASTAVNSSGFTLFCNSWNSSNGRLYLTTSNGSVSVNARTDDNAVTFDQWHYISVVIDRKNGQAAIYVDGVDKTAEGCDSILTDFAINRPLYVGQSPGQGLYFQGNMDKLKIVEKLYSSEEVAAVGKWSFNGNTEDASLQQNNLSLVGALYSSDAKSGSSLTFNGSSDYLKTDNAVTLPEQVTVSAWIKIADKNHSTAIIANASTAVNSSGFTLFCNSWNSSNGRLYLTTSNGSISVNARTDDNAVTFDQWHYISVVIDRKNGQAAIYVDGVDKTADGCDSILTDFAINRPLYVGQSPGQGLYYQGIMDEVEIAGRLLTQSEILTAYQQFRTIADWQFDSNALDSSLGQRDLTAYGIFYDLVDYQHGTASAVFDGNDDYLVSPVVTLPEQFTFSAWIKIADKNHATTIIANASTAVTSSGFTIFCNSWNSSNGRLYLTTSNGSVSVNARTDDNAIIFDQWHYLTVTIDRTNGQAAIYVDGVDKTAADCDKILTDFAIDKQIYVGQSPGQGLYYQGKLDRVKLVEGLLSQSDITNEM